MPCVRLWTILRASGWSQTGVNLEALQMRSDGLQFLCGLWIVFRYCVTLQACLYRGFDATIVEQRHARRIMGGFFNGWRRKAGFVLLVIAMFLFGQWMWSLVAEQHLLLSRTEALVSNGGCLTVVVLDHGGHIGTWFPAQHGDIVYHSGRCWSNEWRKGFAGIVIGGDVYGDAEAELDKARWCRIPYWEIILLLTLFSRFLILRPGKRKTARPTQDPT